MKTCTKTAPAWWLFLALFYNLAWQPNALAVDRYVDPNGTDVAGCTDSANPCQTIAYTVSQSLAGDTITVVSTLGGATVFHEHDITIPFDLTIKGIGQYKTEIDAQDLGRVFSINGNTVIDGVTIRNGNSGFSNGGAIELLSGNLTIIRSRLLDNESNATGGAIAASGSGNVNVSLSMIRGNRASISGGGIWCDECGGVNVVLSRAVDNLAGALGGAIYAESARVLVSTSYIARNTADAGGGIHSNYSLTQVLDTEMTENVADSLDGGAIYTGGSLNIERSSLNGNEAAGQGGAVYLVGEGDFASGNTTFSGNSALCGGGIALMVNFGPGADVLMGTTTFIDNDSTLQGCGEHITGAWNSFELYNSIIANDPGAGGVSNDYCSTPLTGGNHNLIDDASCDTGAADFNLGVINNIDFNLAYNGGLTRSHVLLPGSNAIDTGHNPACLNPGTGTPLTVDQRGKPRPVDSDGNGVAECDIGATELQ